MAKIITQAQIAQWLQQGIPEEEILARVQAEMSKRSEALTGNLKKGLSSMRDEHIRIRVDHKTLSDVKREVKKTPGDSASSWVYRLLLDYFKRTK